jgi:hypothetical protein
MKQEKEYSEGKKEEEPSENEISDSAAGGDGVGGGILRR